MNRQYSRKVTELETEAEQARGELTEAQRQLQELEVHGTRNAADKNRAQECRRKIAAAQSKVQVCDTHTHTFLCYFGIHYFYRC